MSGQWALDERIDDVAAEDVFEVRRRASLYIGATFTPLLLGVGIGWFAWTENDPLLWAAAGLLGLFFLLALPGLLDLRTPLFVADTHGIRMRSGRQWVGLLWREMAGIYIEQREGRHDPCLKVVSPDGSQVYRAPLGFATTVSVGEAEVQLARRQAAAAY